MTVIRTLLAGCVIAPLTGCLSSPAIYPDTWAEQVVSHDGGCPRIDGTYRNSGESYRDYDGGRHRVRSERSLAHILNGGTGSESLQLWNKLGHTTEDPAGDPSSTVSLRLAEGLLHVTAAHADGASRTLALRVREVCRNSVLALEGDWDLDAEEIGPGAPEISRKSVTVGKAADGSLLVHENESAALFFLFVPAFGYREAEWIRFDQVPAAAMAVAAEAP